MSSVRQLPLPFAHRPEFAAADFLEAPSNAAALAWLAREAEWPGKRLALWGPAGCGKTHLLHLWAGRTGVRVLAGPGLTALTLASPDGSPSLRGVAIDDADAAPELALLHTLNTAGEAGLPLLLVGGAPPSRWRVALPDLASRLRAITVVEIGPAEDTLLRMLLARLLAERQVRVAPAVQDWLLLRLPRTQAAIREVAARLDRMALASGQAITRALAAAVLDELAADQCL